jgi:hypothetical protein
LVDHSLRRFGCRVHLRAGQSDRCSGGRKGRGHHDGKCSFETIIKKYDLKEPGLLRLAQIVHAADIAEDLDKDPYARGLEAIAQGYSLMYPEDHSNLEAQFPVYDALYAWCRLEVSK